MRSMILSAAILAVGVPAIPALAQSNRSVQEHREDIRDANQEYREDLRNADSRREVRQARREHARNIRKANRNWRQYRQYDYNRSEPGQSRYYADRYYRSGAYYPSRRLANNDRIYRGENGRYYCRRNDGTTGLILGAAVGGLLGNLIAPGDSKTLGTVIGAAGGGLAGRAVGRSGVRCD